MRIGGTVINIRIIIGCTGGVVVTGPAQRKGSRGARSLVLKIEEDRQLADSDTASREVEHLRPSTAVGIGTDRTYINIIGGSGLQASENDRLNRADHTCTRAKGKASLAIFEFVSNRRRSTIGPSDFGRSTGAGTVDYSHVDRAGAGGDIIHIDIIKIMITIISCRRGGVVVAESDGAAGTVVA